MTHCNTLKHIATHCNTLQRTATHCNTLQHSQHKRVADEDLVHQTCSNDGGCLKGVLQCVAVCFSVLQRVVVCCSVLQCVAVWCSVVQCVAVTMYSDCRSALKVRAIVSVL